MAISHRTGIVVGIEDSHIDFGARGAVPFSLLRGPITVIRPGDLISYSFALTESEPVASSHRTDVVVGIEGSYIDFGQRTVPFSLLRGLVEVLERYQQ